MDSPSTSSTSGADIHPEELDGFDDFTLASSWERFIASVESTCREWQAAGSTGLLSAGATPVSGSRDLHCIHKEISFGKKLYVLILFFRVGEEDDHRDEWPLGLHHLQVWFGLNDFLVAAPVSMNGVILDAPEATTLLSTVAVALSSCGSVWPAFVPVHDPTRKAYKGVQGTSSSYSITFEADRIGSWVPVRFMHLEGLYELFVSKVAFTAPTSAAIPALRVEFTMRLTYQTPMVGFEHHNQAGTSSTAEAKADYDGELPNEPLWDEDLPWAEWHSVEDPIKGFELVTIWSSKFVNSSLEMAEYENVSTYDADKWFLTPTFIVEKEGDQPVEGFASRLGGLVKAFHVAGEAQFLEDFANVVKPEMDILLETFTVPPPSVLERVVKDLFYEAVSPSGEGFSFKKNGHSVKGAPRDSLFGRFSIHSLFFGTCNIRAIAELWLEFVREVRWCWDECQPLPRVSPDEPPDLATCLLHQKLQLLALCIKLKADEREKSKSAVFPKDADTNYGQNVEPKYSKDEVHEKQNRSESNDSHQVDSTIEGVSSRKSSEPLPYFSTERPEDELESLSNPVSQVPESNTHLQSSKSWQNTSVIEDEHDTSSSQASYVSQYDEAWESWETTDVPEADRKDQRRGSAGPFESQMLLRVEEPLHAPLTQRLPVMTEDMVLERAQAIAALRRSDSEKVARIRLQTDILASDMSAFKAANPGAVLEDFVRWHSPRDWLEDDGSEDREISGGRHTEDTRRKWPPKGILSHRMSEPGNVWAQIWEESAPEPAAEQRPLFDFKREGEKVMHYLEIMRPQQLLAQMLCTAFMACADMLKRTRVGDLPRLNSELEELFSSMDIILEPLSSWTIDDVPSREVIEAWHKDLLQLCAVFRKVEKDVFLGASLFQKLKLAPSSMRGLFNSILDDGKGLSRVCVESTTDQRQGGSVGSSNERESVADLFPPPSTNQSMGRRLRMGNYLNGYEPELREVKFQCYEEDLQKPRGSRNGRRTGTKVASHRMYICGTANDLQVALSVVSRD